MCLAFVSLGAMNPVPGVLRWASKGCSGGTGRDGEVEELFCLKVKSCS